MPDDNVVDLNGKKHGDKPKRTPEAIANELGERLKPKRKLTPAQQAHFDKLKADHVPADGHAASGPGWGGPAKGAGQPPGVKGGKGGRMPNGPERDAYLANKIATANALTERLVAMGLNKLTEIDETTGEAVKIDVPLGLQHSAIVSGLDRLEGKSVTRVADTPAGETVEELRNVTVEFVRAKTNP